MTTAANATRRLTYRVSVDYEYNPEDWWDAARASADAPAAVQPLLEPGGPSTIRVAARDAVAIEAWAARLPGYADGPEWARTALLIARV